MADRKKNMSNDKEDVKPTKEEYAVAKFLRFNVPTKPAKLHNMAVHCFFASGAVDALMESKWSALKNAQEPLFVNRNSCVSYCQRLMEKGLFHRAERVQRKKDKDKSDRSKKKRVKDTVEKEDGATGDELRERKIKKEHEEEDPEKSVTCETEEVIEEEKTEEKKEKKDKKEKPIKLVMTDDHTFLDGEENIYVWIYDPASPRTIFIGSLIVFGVAALCLFPLWPPWVHFGVYYASLAGAVFVGFILSLVVLRFILFCVIWLLTLGRHHFWLLPNLTEEVGFLESFQPFYTHKVVLKAVGKAKSKSSKKSKRKARKKSSDKEDTESEPEFEMIGRGDFEEDELEERMEGEEDSEENEEAREEEEYGMEEEEEEEDYEEDEEGQNDQLEDEYEEQEEEEEEEESSELKKDK